MALNSPPLESFSYNGFYDSYLDNGDDMSSFSSLLSNSGDYSSAGDSYASTTTNCPYSVSSFLNFNPEEECNLWIDAMNQTSSHVSKYQNGEMMDIGCSLMINGAIGEKRCSENGRFVFPYPSSSHIDYVQESLKQEKISRKRSYEGVEMQTSKQQCEIERKTKAKAKSLSPSKAKSLSPSKEKSLSPSKANSLSPSKDPQSHAAKIRRERISERLKVLQELVPNGTKVDLVTMLEKAISYVKFLQLQVKVLATDEFWPAQGGTAPDISQVKEALDAILSSNKQRSSTPERSEN